MVLKKLKKIENPKKLKGIIKKFKKEYKA